MKKANSPLRYAFPFFTPKPVSARAAHPEGNSGAAFASLNLGPIPPVKGDSQINLADIIGAANTATIQGAGQILLHCTGDTGRLQGNEQQAVSDAMTRDFQVGQDATNPALFVHLGDVIYGPGKIAAYRDEFYRPYHRYPGKIMAVPGNHDGEVFVQTDPKPLEAFLSNFCAATATEAPEARAAGVFRETMTQPGVYWFFDAPFLQIVGLYSNIAEGPGNLKGSGNDMAQINWLQQTLKKIRDGRTAGRKALIIAVHHPPFSGGGHSGSVDMLGQIDAACTTAGIAPDAVLAGHAHTYQRFTRKVNIGGTAMEVPYVVAGCGGHNDQPVNTPTGTPEGDHTLVKSFQGYGYLRITASAQTLKIDFQSVLGPNGTVISPATFDSVTVDLKKDKIM